MRFETLGGRMAPPSSPSCALGATRVLVLPIYPKKMLGGTPGTPGTLLLEGQPTGIFPVPSRLGLNTNASPRKRTDGQEMFRFESVREGGNR